MTTTGQTLGTLCGACNGTGYQRNIQTGIMNLCPVCHGTGRRATGPYTTITAETGYMNTR